MDEQTARLLLRSLLERLEADARTESPHFTSAVSHLERSALSWLLGVQSQRGVEEGEAQAGGRIALPPAKETAAECASPRGDAEPPVALPDALAERPPNPRSDDERPQLAQTESPVTAQPPLAEGSPSPNVLVPIFSVGPYCGPRAIAVELDESALSFDRPQDEGCVLCLDFGTAKSKACAAVADSSEDPDPLLVELGLGKLDRDLDGAIYSVASSVWISNDGLLYVGSDALRKSAYPIAGGSARRRLDSIKQELTLVTFEQNLAVRHLEPELNPTSIPLSYEDAICLFLAYLTDLATTELASSGRSRYVRRRFTIPSWQPSQRAWAASALAKYIARAQMLADTFSGRWSEGISAEQWKSAVAAAASYDNQLAYLLEGRKAAGGILEPLAAGSGRVWADSATKNLMFVVDVGAGTTDFSLFWVVQNIGAGPPRKAFQVAPYSDAVRMAGDFVDETLLLELLGRAQGSSDDLVRKRIATDLRLRGLRGLKERLFRTGQLQVSLVTDQTITMALDEFLSSDRMRRLGEQIENAIERFLASVDGTWSDAPGEPQLVLTGGAASMPNIRELADRPWQLGGKRISFRRAQELPDFIATTFNEAFQREYPQLAVAIGGVLPVLDERSRLVRWEGSTRPPGPLSRYQVTGV